MKKWGQGRFKAILVDREVYLLDLCRYVELNPVRVGMMGQPGLRRWSGYLAHTGQRHVPAWLWQKGSA